MKCFRMNSPQQYRSLAARCLEIERHSSDLHTQALLLQMAQICQRLARELDQSRKADRNNAA